jgi:hypothetical protein
MKLSLDSLIFCEKKGEKKFGMARSVAGGGHHRQGRVCVVSLERENCQLNTQAIGGGGGANGQDTKSKQKNIIFF